VGSGRRRDIAGGDGNKSKELSCVTGHIEVKRRQFAVIGLWVLIEVSVRFNSERWKKMLAWIFEAVGLLIAVSQVYLVAESFISIRRLPPGANVTVEWVDLRVIVYIVHCA
jgi:hypothetical protein